MANLFVAVIREHDTIRQAATTLLQSRGLRVAVFDSLEEFFRSPRLHDTSCLILDIEIPTTSGLQLQGYFASADRRIPVIFVTACADENARTRAVQAGAADFMHGTAGEESLLDGVRSVLALDLSEPGQ